MSIKDILRQKYNMCLDILYKKCNSVNIRDMLRRQYADTKPIKVQRKSLEIKPSTVKGTGAEAGMGLFTLEPIQKNTIFLECGDGTVHDEKTFERMMNDLAYITGHIKNRTFVIYYTFL
jgi:hypothetical protein